MICEFDVRREIARINGMSLTHLSKARRLLKLARRVRAAAYKLTHLSCALMQDSYGEQAARMRSAAGRLADLHDDIRSEARKVLSLERAPIAFNCMAPGTAYPAWNVAD